MAISRSRCQKRITTQRGTATPGAIRTAALGARPRQQQVQVSSATWRRATNSGSAKPVDTRLAASGRNHHPESPPFQRAYEVVAAGVGSQCADVGCDALLRGHRRTRRRCGRRLARRCRAVLLVRLMATNNTADTSTDDRVLAGDVTGHATDRSTGKTTLGTSLSGQQRSTSEHNQRQFRNVHGQLSEVISMDEGASRRPHRIPDCRSIKSIGAP